MHLIKEKEAAMEDREREYPQGIKWTRQRKDVYEVLMQAAEPMSAIQIYNHIEKTEQTGNYAISTIYRILAVFEEKKLVRKMNWMGEDKVVYELNKGEHTHYAVCINCHKRIPLHTCPFEHMRENIEENEFLVTEHKLELYGYCKQCRER